MNDTGALRTSVLVCTLAVAASTPLTACDKSNSAPPPPATVIKGSPAPGSPATAPTTTPSGAATTPPVSTNTANSTFPPANQTPPDDPKVAVFSGLTAPKPATWIWHPPQRQFAVAEYAVPGVDNADQARIVAFGRIGGSLEQNIERWQGQFSMPDGSAVAPKIDTLEADGMAITLVELYGNYRGMNTAGFNADTLFIAAVIQSPQGQLFVRFLGPRITVEANREAFMTMIRELKKSQ